MSADILNPKPSGPPARDLAHAARVHEENAALVARLTRLRTALEEAARQNAELRREVARLRAENEHLHGTSTFTDTVARARYGDRAARIRVMLRDQHSRNP